MPNLNRDANSKFLIGDGIDDMELANLRRFYRDLLEHLEQLNESEFQLFKNEVCRRKYQLDGFASARKERN